MALKRGHCSETQEGELGAFTGGLFTVKIRRGLSPGVPQLHVSKLSTHEGVKGSAGLSGKQSAPTPKLQMSSGMKRAALQGCICQTVHHSDAGRDPRLAASCVPLCLGEPLHGRCIWLSAFEPQTDEQRGALPVAAVCHPFP